MTPLKLIISLSIFLAVCLAPLSSRAYLQVILLPLILALAIRVRLFGVRIPRILIALSAVGAVLGVICTYYRLSFSPGAFVVYNTAEGELGQATKIYRDRLRRSLGGGDGIRLVSGAHKPIEDLISARMVLAKNRELAGVIWGNDRVMRVALREYPPISFASMADASVARGVLSRYRVSDLFISLSIDGFGVSHGHHGATVYFLSRIMKAWSALPKLFRSAANSGEVEVSLEALGRMGAKWRSRGHLAVPLWLAGTLHLLRAIEGPVLQRGELRCAKSRLRGALKVLAPRENTALQLAIRNNLALTFLVQASYGIDSAKALNRARKLLQKGAKVARAANNRGDDRSLAGELIRLQELMFS